MTVTESQARLISSAPPSRVQKRAALATTVLLLLVFFSVLPFAHVRLARLDVFIAVFATILFLTDLMSAVLLYAHFAILRPWRRGYLPSGKWPCRPPSSCSQLRVDGMGIGLAVCRLDCGSARRCVVHCAHWLSTDLFSGLLPGSVDLEAKEASLAARNSSVMNGRV